MKNVLRTVLLLFFALQLNAQKELPCGFKVDEVYMAIRKDPNSSQNQRLKYLKTFPIKELYRIEAIEYKNGKYSVLADDKSKDASSATKESIPVVVHNICKNDGSGGLSDAQIIGMIDTLNARYLNFGFNFILCSIRNINNSIIFQTQFDSNDDNEENPNASYTVLDVINRNVTGKINIYLAPSSRTSWAFGPTPDPRKQHIMVKHAQTQSSTIAHEVGHWFGLLHTHGDYDDPVGELVQRTNCYVAGDLLCDTPADPGLTQNDSFWVDRNCNYAPKLDIRDANGDAYAPDTRNIMSYSRHRCRTFFSNEQVYTMHEVYSGLEFERGYKFSNCGTQKGWRWCVKCQVLFFTGDGQDSGVCPAGQKHTPNPTSTDSRKSGKYLLDRGSCGTTQQDGWRWCNKCQGLFFTADHNDAGTCPAGDKHIVNASANDSRRSGLYSLDYRQAADPASTGQQKWRQCGKCQGLFYSSDGKASGVCPSRNKHVPAGDKETVLHYAVKRP